MTRFPLRISRPLLLAAVLAAGCSIDPNPKEQIDTAQPAIVNAQQAEAAALAASDLDLARRWAEAKDYRPARWLAEQARLDAELAEMKAISAKARTAAVQATREFRRIVEAKDTP